MAATWQLTRDRYRLNRAGLRGTVALRGAAPGIRKLALRWNEKTLNWPGPLLAVRSIQAAGRPPFPVGLGPTRPDHRLRSNLLDFQLDETDRCPVRLQIYWSAERLHQIDVEILATTTRAFDKLEVLTWSEVPARDVAQRTECLVRAAADRGRWIDVREPSQWDAAAPFQSPIVCYRPAGQSWSYVEMCHPNDCCRIVVKRRRRTVEWGFGLFGLDIEKGVILRGRVRGVFIRRRRDTDQATRLFKRFVAETPHLSV